jgi:acyl-CoA reductase-like NAD-dependent aldehyde dehydrogenase
VLLSPLLKSEWLLTCERAFFVVVEIIDLINVSPDELGALATALRDEMAPSPPGQQAHVIREPYGVVYAVAPWNGPFTLGLRAVANPIVRLPRSSRLSPG